MELSKSHRAYFKAAKSMSELSDFPRVKVGCVAVMGHNIIASGYNRKRTDPLQKEYNKYRFQADTMHTLHAEAMCIKNLLKRKDVSYRDVTLYISRYDVNGKPMLSKPCRSCQRLIKDIGIRKCFYTNYGGYTYEEFFDME